MGIAGCSLWETSLTRIGLSSGGKGNVRVSGLPEVEREFRAAWVATVANIDWPSAPGLDAQEQQTEALAILDAAQNLGLNALILQVRPQCDALYESRLEPWSYYLSGTQGLSPGYDPLAFWIEAAHDRGLELHAWFNPYRAHHPAGGEIGDASIVRRHPELAHKLGDEGYYWLDPALPRVQAHSREVILDVLRRYDIDGIHLDDYFYPYPSYNDGRDFPDDKSWHSYQRRGGKLARGDWRRKHVDTFVEKLYRQIKKTKKHVRFGISPFGIWRPGHPASIKGLDQYAVLYADARRWLRQGWIDYWTPQLYWPIRQIPQSYPVLLNWWAKHNTKGRHLWPGIISGQAQGERETEEFINQIMIARGAVPQGPGHVHFSMKGLLHNRGGLADSLRAGPYAQAALSPATPWLGSEAPPAPRIKTVRDGDRLMLVWEEADIKKAFRWVVYWRYGDQWHYRLFNRKDRVHRLDFIKPRAATQTAQTADSLKAAPQTADQTPPIHLSAVAVVAIDRLGNQSDPTLAFLPRPQSSPLLGHL
jgi:uncharacterized lipoprotein YddW (UPF0748 family)